MSINLVIPADLQHLTDQREVIEVQGKTVGECLEHALHQFPKLRPLLSIEKGQLPTAISLYVNGVDSYPEELSTEVHDGDKLHLVRSSGCC
jgi:molybdopterin converting factor small subunit